MLTQLISQYGYLIILAGTLLEGETVLLAAGFAIHQGMLDWRIVWPLAIFGATLGDQGFFLLGRWKGQALIKRYPTLQNNVLRVQSLMEQHHVLFILALRFLYGLRIAGPLILGAGKLPLHRFTPLNLLGALLWASLILGIGYGFGLSLKALLSHIHHVEELALLALFGLGGGFWLWRHQRRQRP